MSPRMSRTVKLVLLGSLAAGGLTVCLIPTRKPAPPEPRYDENGNPLPAEQTASATAHGGSRSSWWWFWPRYPGYRSTYWSGGGSSYRGGWSSPSPGRPSTGGGTVTRGGFGGSGSRAGGFGG